MGLAFATMPYLLLRSFSIVCYLKGPLLDSLATPSVKAPCHTVYHYHCSCLTTYLYTTSAYLGSPFCAFCLMECC